MSLVFKRGTRAQIAATIPQVGQPVWNKDDKVLSIGDGVTPGGISVAMTVTGGVPTHTHVVSAISDLTPYTSSFLTTVNSIAAAQAYFDAASSTHTHTIGAIIGVTPYAAGFMSSINGALDASTYINAAPAIHTHNVVDITDIGVWATDFLYASDAVSARAALGLGDSALLDVGDVFGTVATGDHVHSVSAISGLQAEIDGKAGKSGSWVAGDIPQADANGDLTDSGTSISFILGALATLLNGNVTEMPGAATYTLTAALSGQTIVLGGSAGPGNDIALLPDTSTSPTNIGLVVSAAVSATTLIEIHSVTAGVSAVNSIGIMAPGDSYVLQLINTVWTIISRFTTGSIRTDLVQTFTNPQKALARTNINAEQIITPSTSTSVYRGDKTFAEISSFILPQTLIQDFGTGEDGSAVLDGVNTFPWATLVGSTYTMQRSVGLVNCTVNNGIILVTNGWRIYVNSTLTNNGLIHNNGTNGANANVGVAGNGSVDAVSNDVGGSAGIGFLHDGATGQGSNTSGINATAVAVTSPVVGGGAGISPTVNTSGGAGGLGAGGGGGSGATTVATLGLRKETRQFFSHTDRVGNAVLLGGLPGGGGGSGGGSSGGVVSGAGGGGGGGGGVIHIAAFAIAGTAGIISANGGTGGNGGAANGGNKGGGGGGGGGFGGAVFIYYAYASGTVTANAIGGNGGNGGALSGTGLNGAGGTAGGLGRIFAHKSSTKTTTINNSGTLAIT